MKTHQATFVLLLATCLLLVMQAGAGAQWTHGQYVSTVISHSGTYGSGGNTSYGNNWATSTGDVHSRYSVTFTAPSGTPDQNVTPTGHLYGSKSGNASAVSIYQADTGQCTDGTSGGSSSYDSTPTLPVITLSGTSVTLYLDAWSSASAYPGGSSNANTYVYFQ